MLRRTALGVLSLVPLAALGACKKGPKRVRIAVVPKGTTHEFWKAVHAGASAAASELDVDVVWKGPLKEDDLKQQIDVVQGFTAQGVSGIVLAPLSDKALTGAVKGAVGAGIPVVVFDSDLQGSDHVSFVATDNLAAGKQAGEHLVKLLGGEACAPARCKVVMLRYQEGSASTQHRERGFLDVVKAASGLEVVSDNQYGGATTESAFSKSESLLSAQKAGEGGVHGVFCPNESTTFGMLLALQKAGLAGKVKLVGFDASDKLVRALRDGHIAALVLQNPRNIGYLAVKTMVRHLRGEKVEARLDTGSTLVTRDDLDKPEVKALLEPGKGPE